jgi:hypothetical protein
MGGVPGGDLRADYTRRGLDDKENWGNDIIELCGVVGWTRGTQVAVCGESAKQSKHWPEDSVRMEILPEFALKLERGDSSEAWRTVTTAGVWGETAIPCSTC